MKRILPLLAQLLRHIKAAFFGWISGEAFGLVTQPLRRMIEITIAVPLVLGQPTADSADHQHGSAHLPQAPTTVADGGVSPHAAK